jgi:DUF1009 family protein
MGNSIHHSNIYGKIHFRIVLLVPADAGPVTQSVGSEPGALSAVEAFSGTENLLIRTAKVDHRSQVVDQQDPFLTQCA